MNYHKFLENKTQPDIDTGFNSKHRFNSNLFDFQKDCVKWALKRGRAALFQDCGLGKTIQQLEWAKHVYQHTHKDVLILAPLAVSKQTKQEGGKFGIKVNVCRSQDDIQSGINISNYEILHKFNSDHFSGIVLDESSILKSFSGKYRNQIIQSFKNTPFKLACTATPAPNDYMELGNHSEFLGIMTRSEMLSMFFINNSGDTGKWRLKGHAESEFWKWMSSWSVMIRKPSDLGYDDNDFMLPKIHYHHHVTKSKPKHGFFITEARGIQERRQARRESINERIRVTADLIKNTDEIWLLWSDLNIESEKLKKEISESVEVKGADSDEHKVKSMINFSNGKIKRLISKPSICGFGMNFQVCHNIAFVGLSDSFEKFYQAIRRCWRFGQKEEVHVHIITSEAEGAVVTNVKRKEKEADKMFTEMTKHMSVFSEQLIRGSRKDKTGYNPIIQMRIPNWLKK